MREECPLPREPRVRREDGQAGRHTRTAASAANGARGACRAQRGRGVDGLTGPRARGQDDSQAERTRRETGLRAEGRASHWRGRPRRSVWVRVLHPSRSEALLGPTPFVVPGTSFPAPAQPRQAPSPPFALCPGAPLPLVCAARAAVVQSRLPVAKMLSPVPRERARAALVTRGERHLSPEASLCPGGRRQAGRPLILCSSRLIRGGAFVLKRLLG